MTGSYQNSIWISHSGLSDFLKCRRAYFLKYVYRNPQTGNKMTIAKPALSLGQAVHEVIDSIADMKVEERLLISLSKKLDTAWLKVTGKKGGFKNFSEEVEYRDRAISMLKRLEENPGILAKKATRIPVTNKINLPVYDFSVEHGIKLCGKVDWLSYNEETDSVHIYDFKTGKNEESEDSLQLPIYYLITTHTQKRNVDGASYWYLDRPDGVVEKKIPDTKEAEKIILETAIKMKDIRQNGIEKCDRGICMHCRDLERVFKGEGELVDQAAGYQDVYYLAS